MTYIPKGSKIVYSDYQASLNNGNEIDSGYIDLENVDKIQFSGSASVSGMTVVISSYENDSQAPLVSTVTYNDGPFYLFNIICRQRFMRFQWQNNTGSTVSEVSMELKASYGGSDKLSVFPVGVEPSDFSQAALVQAILRGRDSDGNYVNVGTNEVGALNTSSFLLDVARLKYDNYRIGTKFGRNPDIDTGSGPEDVWNGGGVYTGFNATANENLECFSSSASDSGTLVSSGTATGGSSTTLVDSGATFVTDGVAVGDLIINDTQGFHGVVTAVTSETVLTVWDFVDGSLDDFTFSNGDTYRVATTNGTGVAVTRWENILNSDYEDQGTVYFIMNGTTGVNYTVDAMRCSRGKCVLTGSNEANVGTITLRQATTTANVLASMAPDGGQTEICCDTVESGKTRIITNLKIDMVRANGSAGSADVRFQIRQRGEGWQTKRYPSIQNGGGYNPNINADLIIREGSDIRWRVDDVSDNNTIISAEFEYIDIDNSVV